LNFGRQQIADMCRKLGPTLDAALLPDGIQAEQLLWAICGNESSFGYNCTPRHEPAFDVGGTYAQAPAQAALLEKFGSDGACSYGPMQVMLVNAPSGFTPASFDDLESAIAAGVFALGNLMRHNRPRSLQQIGSCYNAGHIQTRFSSQVAAYVTRLQRNYGVAMPTEATQ
jgi:hypothetical protein